MRFLQLKFLLPLIGAVILLLGVLVLNLVPRFCASNINREVIEGIHNVEIRHWPRGHPCVWAYFGPDEITIVDVPKLPLDDIREELGVQCSPSNSPLSGFTYCYVDEFSFSHSYVDIYAGTRDEICDGGRRVEKFGGIFFTVEPGIPNPTYCGFRLTIQFEDGTIFTGEVVLEGGPRPEVVTKYKLVLANPGKNMPIAGIVYNHEETGEVFYLVTRMVYG